MTLYLLALIGASLAAGLVAAGQAGSAAPPNTSENEATILALIGDAGCDAAAQCRTIAMGAKACGGPKAFLAWSIRRTDEATLRAAADSYSARMRVEVSQSAMVSNCAIVTDPGAQCVLAVPTIATADSGAQRVCRLRGARQVGVTGTD